MIIDQKPRFQRIYKKLHANQLPDVNHAIRNIAGNPDIGKSKTGNLTGIQIHKFKMNKQQMLLAYTWNPAGNTLTLLALGSHENFYRDLKNLGG